MERAYNQRSAAMDPAEAATRISDFAALLPRFENADDAARRGVERIAAAFDAAAAALVVDGAPRLVTGEFAAGGAGEELARIGAGETRPVALDGARTCHATAVEVDSRPATRIVLAREGRPLAADETALARAMGTLLAVRLRSLRLIESERRLRDSSERQAAENLRLLGSLLERQELLERLSRIQRAIVDRRPVHEVLEAIAEASCELIGDEVSMLRLLDRDDPSQAILVAAVGANPDVVRRERRYPARDGIGGRAIGEGALVVIDAATEPDPELRRLCGALDVAVAMATPIYERGEIAGSLAIAARRRRQFEPRDRQILRALAEHASLALNHARALEEAIHESFHDSLTGLPNRALFLDRLGHALARAERSNRAVGVMFCDLDGFKTINDSLGPRLGDQLLVEVGRRLAASLGPADTVARLGGDEFAVLIDELADRRDAVAAARRILTALEAPIELSGREVYAAASVGIATGTGEPETLLRNADLAMYRAKAQGRGKYAAFEPEMHAAVVERLDLEVDLKRAIEDDELILFYQPIFELRSGALAGLEALVRWHHPTRGLVAPARFVPLAEQSGHIGALGRWVLRTACRQAALWQAKYPAHLGLGVSVNVSGVELREPRMVDDVAAALAAAGLDPGSLTIEITETALMEDSETSVGRLEALKGLGVGLAVDDFGTGYSSLRYLQRFPLDSLKIDRFFVADIGGEDERPALMRAMVDLAENFGLVVVAEGIESSLQRDRLVALGCERGQGRLLSPPLAVEDADALLLGAGLLPPGASAADPHTARRGDERRPG
jgi:diguanylate cyclase (GGDEF)-like protein